MTRDEIISMAQQVAKEFDYLWCNNIPELERFAELVAARERETVLNEVLRGLRSERDTDQLRAIIAEVEAIRAGAEKETK